MKKDPSNPPLTKRRASVTSNEEKVSRSKKRDLRTSTDFLLTPHLQEKKLGSLAGKCTGPLIPRDRLHDGDGKRGSSETDRIRNKRGKKGVKNRDLCGGTTAKKNPRSNTEDKLLKKDPSGRAAGERRLVIERETLGNWRLDKTRIRE